MPHATGVVVYNFTQAIHDPERPVFRQCMPRVKRCVFCKFVLLRAIEILLRDINGCYLMERGLLLLPFTHGVFNTQTVRCSWLHQKLYGCVAFVEHGT